MRHACQWISTLAVLTGGFVRAGEFVDVAVDAGLSFRHVSPVSEQRHIHLTMGSGVGWVDVDRDDRPDLYFAQGRAWGVEASEQSAGDRLFRQHGGHFVDLTDAARVRNLEYAMGIAVGDFDNDGFPDLYVSNFGRNRLFTNNGDGTFTEQAAGLGMDHAGFGASCNWVDLDGDGNLDLYVTNYVVVDPENYPVCYEDDVHGRRIAVTCAPWTFDAAPDVVFRNLGDGTFQDVTAECGVGGVPAGPGLGVAAADFDDDGDQDVYVANDSAPNFLWLNDGSGRFTEAGILSGTALNRSGQREAGMGVAVGDGDGDGRFDLFVTNYFAETNTWYRNYGNRLFLDVTDELGLAAPSRTRLGFGTLLLDVDNDSAPDLFIANGHVHDRLQELGRDIPYAQPDQLLIQQNGRFVDVSETSGAHFQAAHVGRGCAAADYNRDGRIDVVVQNLDEPAALLENRSDTPHRSLAIELIGTHSSRDAIGAVVRVDTGREVLTRLREGSTSYLSCNEGVIHVGLGDAENVKSVSVNWPSGRREVFRNIDLRDARFLRLREGTGSPD